MIGGAIGAYVLVSLPGERLKLWISAYLLVLGFLILLKALYHTTKVVPMATTRVVPLGFFGGLVDAIGGGGWGPLVASTLLGNGGAPRQVFGSVNLAEFFVTLTISATFVATVGLSMWPIVTGLVIGGVIAAPFAALATKYLPDRLLMVVVGIVVVTLSCGTILNSLG